MKSQDELAVMDGGKCILQLRGVRPFFSDKYDITRHENYGLLLDINPKNEFDIAAFVKKKREKRMEINSDTEFTQVECKAETSPNTDE